MSETTQLWEIHRNWEQVRHEIIRYAVHPDLTGPYGNSTMDDLARLLAAAWRIERAEMMAVAT